MVFRRLVYHIPVLLLLIFFFSSCTVVKNPPQGKPFIFEANVHVRGDLQDADRKDLELQLANQFHDSLKIKYASKIISWRKPYLIPFLPIIPRTFFELRLDPNRFDSLNAEKTVGYMREHLNALGYFRDSISYTVKIDTVNKGNELQTTLDFYVYPRTVTRLDSIAYRLNADTSFAITARQKQNLDTIQKITIDNLNTTLIKKGDPFSKYKLSSERDRLADIYRNNGYLRFSEEEMLVLWDTVGLDLLRPTIDPVEQAQLLQRLAERRANPVADVEFRLRDNPDSTRITRYYVGEVVVYPEFTSDTTVFEKTDSIENYLIKHNKSLFKKKIFPDYIFLNPGDLYRQSNLLKTQNKFNALSAWRIVNIQPKPRQGKDTADFEIRLTPASKYGFNTNFEISRNQGNITYAQGSLIGLGVTTGVQNRNVQRGANQSSLNLRYGTELNADIGDLIQSRQISVGYSLQIPRIVPKFMRFFSRSKENTNATILSLNGGQTDRKDYFSLTTLNTSLGFQKAWNNKVLTLRLPNIEYNLLQKKDSLDALIAKNASYQYIFNTGMIISIAANYTEARSKERVTSVLTLGGELSGLAGLVKSRAFGTTLHQFVKFDAEYRQTHKYGLNAFAWRIFGGIGLATPGPTDGDTINRFLPFFRQYFAGGPASMRAWRVRNLGPGSTIKSFADTDAPDRFGDVRLEANAEYRIHLFNYGVIGVQTVLFTDIGNIWFLRTNSDFPDGEFQFSKFWKDIAIGVGTGLRIDLSTFLKIRLDYGYKLKNPSPADLAAQNKWAYGWQLFNGQLQLGIDYPF